MENTKTPQEIVEEITQYFTGNGDYCFTYVTPEDCLKALKQALNIQGVSNCCPECNSTEWQQYSKTNNECMNCGRIYGC